MFEVELETGHLVVTGAGVDDDAIRAAVIEAGCETSDWTRVVDGEASNQRWSRAGRDGFLTPVQPGAACTPGNLTR